MMLFGIEIIHLFLMAGTQLAFVVALLVCYVAGLNFSSETKKSLGLNWVFYLILFANLVSATHILMELLDRSVTPEEISETKEDMYLMYTFHAFLIGVAGSAYALTLRIKETADEYGISRR